MVTLIGAILGFLGSMVPEILSLFKQRADRAHELAILALQREMREQAQSERLEEIRLVHDSAQMKALYTTYRTDIVWVDALNGSVRPVLAYAFFLLYATVKMLQFSVLDLGQPLLPWQLWGEEDQAIFAAIISFYFGQRSFGKARR
jgi:Holin of 3TMs, for gene-transfer release